MEQNKKANLNIKTSIGNAPQEYWIGKTHYLIDVSNEEETNKFNNLFNALDKSLNEGNKTKNEKDELWKQFGEQTENFIQEAKTIKKNINPGVVVKLLDRDRNHLVSVVDENGNKHPWFIAPLSAILDMPDRKKQFFKNLTIVEMLAKEKGKNRFTIENKDIYRYYQVTSASRMIKEDIRKDFIKDLFLFRQIRFVLDDDILCHGKTFNLKNHYFLSYYMPDKTNRKHTVEIDKTYYEWQQEKGKYAIDKRILKKDVKTSIFMIYSAVLNIIDSNKNYVNFNYLFNCESLKSFSFYRTDDDIQENTSGKGVHGASKDYWNNEFKKDLNELGKNKQYSLLVSEINKEGNITIYNAIDEDESKAMEEFIKYCEINNTKNPY